MSLYSSAQSWGEVASFLPSCNLDRVIINSKKQSGREFLSFDITVSLGPTNTPRASRILDTNYAVPPSFGREFSDNIHNFIYFMVVLKTTTSESLEPNNYIRRANNSRRQLTEAMIEPLYGLPHVTKATFSGPSEVVYIGKAFDNSSTRIDLNQNLEQGIVHNIVIDKNIESPDITMDVFSVLDLEAFCSSNGIGLGELQLRDTHFAVFSNRTKILENSNLVAESFVLLTSAGNQYTGPFTVENGEYFPRLDVRDSDADTDALTKVPVPNYKIQDFRGQNNFEPEMSQEESPFSQEQISTLFGDRLLGAVNNLEERNQSSLTRENSISIEEYERQTIAQRAEAQVQHLGDKLSELPNATITMTARKQYTYQTPRPNDRNIIIGTIEYDQLALLIKHSKLGHILANLPPEQQAHCLWWGDTFRLIEARIIRRRLQKRFKGWNQYGVRARSTFDGETVEEIVAANGENARYTAFDPHLRGADEFFSPSSLLTNEADSLGIADSDINFNSKLYDVDNWVSEGVDLRNSFNLESYQNNPTTGLPCFPWKRRLKFSSFSPITATGVYQYGIELTYEDGVINYVREVATRMQMLLPFVQSFARFCQENVAVSPDIYFTRLNETLGNIDGLVYDVASTYADAVRIVASSNAAVASIDANNILLSVFYCHSSLGGGYYYTQNLGEVKLREMFLKAFEKVTLEISRICELPLSNNTDYISGEKAPNRSIGKLIKVKKFFGEDLEAAPGKVSGGVVDLSIQDLPSVSILPVGDVDESTQGFVDPEVIRELVIFEDIKFGGNDPSANANRTAYFTPNEFLGSRVMSLRSGYAKMRQRGSSRRSASQRERQQSRFDSVAQVNLGGLTYTQALKALEASKDLKIREADRRRKVLTVELERKSTLQRTNPTQYSRLLAKIVADHAQAIRVINQEYNTKLGTLQRRQINGDFVDEDLLAAQQAGDFDLVNLNQQLEVVDLVNKLLRVDRGPYTRLEDKTPEELRQMTKELFQRRTDAGFPGLTFAADFLGVELPEEVEVPTEEECSALSERQLAALTHNLRVEITPAIVTREFENLTSDFERGFTSYVKNFQENTEGIDDLNYVDGGELTDPMLVKNAIKQEKNRLEQIERDRIAEEERRRQEEIARRQANPEQFPFQLDRVTNGDTEFGLTQDGSRNEAIYGNFYKLQRRQIVPLTAEDLYSARIPGYVQVRLLRMNPEYVYQILRTPPKYEYVDVSIADALDGLEPGMYRFFPWEDSENVQSKFYILESQYFQVREQTITTRDPEFDLLPDFQAELETLQSQVADIQAENKKLIDLRRRVDQFRKELVSRNIAKNSRSVINLGADIFDTIKTTFSDTPEVNSLTFRAKKLIVISDSASQYHKNRQIKYYRHDLVLVRSQALILLQVTSNVYLNTQMDNDKRRTPLSERISTLIEKIERIQGSTTTTTELQVSNIVAGGEGATDIQFSSFTASDRQAAPPTPAAPAPPPRGFGY